MRGARGPLGGCGSGSGCLASLPASGNPDLAFPPTGEHIRPSVRGPAHRALRILSPHPDAATMKSLRHISTAAVLLLFLTGPAWAQRRTRQGAGGNRDDGSPQPWLWGSSRQAPQPQPQPAGPQRPTPSTPAPPSAPSSPSPQQLVDARGHPVNCSCPSTEEHNPVCGSNGATYNNPGKLRCAQRCGYEVQLSFYGNCAPSG